MSGRGFDFIYDIELGCFCPMKVDFTQTGPVLFGQ